MAELVDAARRGDVAAVVALLVSGVPVDACDAHSRTALMAAAHCGAVDVIDALLERGAHVNVATPDGVTALLVACIAGNADAVRALLQHGADVDSADSDGTMPLCVAAQAGHAAVVATLITNNARIDHVDNKGVAPLHVAALNGHIEVANTLIASGADVNRTDVDGVTPLFVAAQYGHLSIVQALVCSGAQTHVARKNGMTPLYQAAEQGHSEVVKALLAAGAAIDALDAFNVTPLFIASQEGHVAAVHVLLAHGASVDCANVNNATPLFIAAHAGHADVVTVLLGAGADANHCDGGNATPLYVAAEKGHVAAVQALVQSGCCIDSRSTNGITPLFVAAKYGHANVVRFLAASGSDVDAVDHVNVTPLFIATQNGYLEVVDALLQSDASVYTRNGDGLTAMHITSKQDDTRIVASLAACGGDVDAEDPHCVTPLIMAILNDRVSIVRALLDVGATVNKVDCGGSTPLMYAARQGRVDMMHVLVAHGANVNASCLIGRTPLSEAARHGHVDAAVVLLDRGVPIDLADTSGATPLFVACTNGHNAVVHELLRRGADVERALAVGTTPLAVACDHGHIDIVQALLARGANVTVTDTSGCTALHIASWCGHARIIDALLQSNAPPVIDAIDVLGNTPLLCASRQGHVAVVQSLLDAGACTDVTNAHGETAVTAAAVSGKFDVATALLDAGATVDVRPQSGDTVVIAAARWGDREFAQSLVARGCLARRSHVLEKNARDPTDATTDSNVMAATFETLRSYVQYMPEFASMWIDVVHRVEALYAHTTPRDVRDCDTTIKRADKKDEEEAQLHSVLRLVFALVKLKAAFEASNVFTRLVMSRLVTRRIRDLHTEMHALAASTSSRAEESSTHGVSNAQHEMLTSFRAALQRDDVATTLAFRSDADWIESIALLQHELVARADQYDADMLALFRESLAMALRLSTASSRADNDALPAVPTWLIPFHELAVEGLHTGVPHSSALRPATWLDADVLLIEVHDVSTAHFCASVDKWHRLSHPNVVEVFGGSHLRQPLVAVCASAVSTNLRDHVAAAPQSVVWQALRDVALGVKFLHERGVVLGDLQCASIWVDARGVARINGLCTELLVQQHNDNEDDERIRWRAPECVRGDAPTIASDIYALGMCMLEAASGAVPWHGIAREQVEWAVRTATRPPRPATMTLAQWRLVKSMCWSDPAQRTSITRVLEQLKRFVATELEREIASRDAFDRVDNAVERQSLGSNAAVSAATDICDYVFPALETTIPLYVARLQYHVSRCDADSRDAVEHVLLRLVSIYDWLVAQHKAPTALGVDVYCDALHAFHGFLRVTATTAHSIAARTQSQRASLHNNVLHREVDDVLDVLEMPGVTVDAIHNWQDAAATTGPTSSNDIDDTAADTDARSNGVHASDAVEIVRYESADAEQAIDSEQWRIPIYELTIERGDPVGTGAFGVVYRGTWCHTRVVIKYMGRRGTSGCRHDLFLHELRVWLPLRHPNVARLYGANDVDKRYFVGELVANGTLRDYLQASPRHRTKTWRMLRDVARGLAYLHAHNVLHNDLKCDNLLVGDDETVKIIDFGLSSVLERAEIHVRSKSRGAVRWRSPEYLRGTERLTLASDVYAFGMCVIEAATGALPWGAMHDVSVRSHVLRKQELPPRPSAAEMTDSQWHLVQLMCAFKPRERVDIAFVVDRLAEFAQQEAAANLESVVGITDAAP